MECTGLSAESYTREGDELLTASNAYVHSSGVLENGHSAKSTEENNWKYLSVPKCFMPLVFCHHDTQPSVAKRARKPSSSQLAPVEDDPTSS